MQRSRYIAFALLLIVGFQNCGGVNFTSGVADSSVSPSGNGPLGELGVCDGVSCDLTPLTRKPAVITILLALGDEADSQLVVNGASSQLIAETVVRYSSPVADPKILVVMDRGRGGEDPEDTIYVRDALLQRYRATVIEEPADGLKAADLNGYDLIWFNNPGAPMTDVRTRDTLIAFGGGVVIQGDDLSQGSGFSNEELTGLRAIDNGVEVTCNGTKYRHDNNTGEQFRVTINPAAIPGANEQALGFLYGNDIDLTQPIRPGLEVVAYAQGGPSICTEKRPAIVRYQK